MATYNLRIEKPTKLVSGDIIQLPARYGSQAGGSFALDLPKGEYLLEAWGSSGSSIYSSGGGGPGGYAHGVLRLSSKLTAYLTAGCRGTNGGSVVRNKRFPAGVVRSGGASDIRLLGNSMYTRVLVAGGGGGNGAVLDGFIKEDEYGRQDTFNSYSTTSLSGGNGGGAVGEDGEEQHYVHMSTWMSGKGGSFTSGGSTGMAYAQSYAHRIDGSFGYGGEWTGDFSHEAYRYIYGPGAPGGGGWYGGGGGGWYEYQSGTHRVEIFGSGGGGSGYVWTAETSRYAPSNFGLTPVYYLTDAYTASWRNSGEGSITITVLSVFNGIYIGSSAGKALAVKGIYVGDSAGKAKRVIKGYIGDSNGKAKRFL